MLVMAAVDDMNFDQHKSLFKRQVVDIFFFSLSFGMRNSVEIRHIEMMDLMLLILF